MATVGIVSPDEQDRLRLSTLAGESGHLAHAASGTEGVIEILRERRPKVLLVVDSPQSDAEVMVREIQRAAPLLPVVVALKVRDANRALVLMRTGAFEVVAPPWTKEDLKACLAKSLRAPGTALAAVQLPPPRRAGPIYLLAFLVFLAAAFAALSRNRQAAARAEALQRKAGWDLPSRHPAGLAFDEGKLWVLDWYAQALYAHDPADPAPVRRIIHFPSRAPAAISFGKESAWSALPSGTVIRHLKDGNWTPGQSFPASGRVAGMVYDGLYLWTCDAKSKLLRKHLVDDRLTVLASAAYPGGKPAALAFDGEAVWSLDSLNRVLLRHDSDQPGKITRRVSLREYQDGRYQPAGLAWDGGRFWTLAEKLPQDSGPARLFLHELEAQRP